MTSNRMTTAPRLRLAVAASVTALLVTLLPSSSAVASGLVARQTDVIYRTVFRMKAGLDYVFTTRNLSANADTILHVMSYPSGNFIAGNDNYILGQDPDNPGPPVLTTASRVIIPAQSVPPIVDRVVYLVVRSKPGTPSGSGDLELRTQQSGAVISTQTLPIQFSTGALQNVASLAAGTHLTTVERNLGTVDTAILVASIATPELAFGFDDNDGIDGMSFLRLGTTCVNCQIVVGTPTPWISILSVPVGLAPGLTNLIWDESVEGLDTDGDGLSNQLETDIVGTSPVKADTDADGISDGAEVYGAVYKGPDPVPAGGGMDGNLLKFPKYGANPNVKDVFIELDWLASCPGTTAACLANKDNLRMTAAQLLAARNAMASAAISIHIDAAVASDPGDPNVSFGDWGGASRLPDGDGTFVTNSAGAVTGVYVPSGTLGDVLCGRGQTPGRYGFFHHYITASMKPRSGFAFCGTSTSNPGTFAHEVGHNFKLRHGGPDGALSYSVNCKMNYASVMSYPNQFLSGLGFGYSGGPFASRILNALSMNETTGLGTALGTILDVFDGGALSRGLVNRATGGIDWNMNGRIDPSPVRAPTNWANSTCAAPYLRANWNLLQATGVAFPTLHHTLGAFSAPQLFAKSNANIIIYGGDASGCQQIGTAPCTTWTQRASIPMPQSDAFAPASALAVAGPLIVFRSQTTSRLAYFRRTSSETWEYSSLGFSSPSFTGDPAAIETNGQVKVYAVSGGRLRVWIYDEATNTWPTQGVDQTWTDGTAVQSALGISVAHGVVRPDGAGIFAAIPDAGAAAMAPFPIQFARVVNDPLVIPVNVPPSGPFPGFSFTLTLPRDRWARLPMVPAGTAPPTTALAKPGLAYVPFSAFAPDDGRFYLTFVNASQVAGIMFSEGNDRAAGAADRVLRWKLGQQTTFTDDNDQGRLLPAGVVLALFGSSLVGATSRVFTHYFPAADGIINMDMRDHNEIPFIHDRLACSISGCR
jgi:hypothetical protein